VLSVLDSERVPGAAVTAERVRPVEFRPLDSAVDEKVNTSGRIPWDLSGPVDEAADHTPGFRRHHEDLMLTG